MEEEIVHRNYGASAVSRTLTLEEAAVILKTSADTVGECIRSRGLPAAKIGRAYVMVEADVIEWVRTQYGKQQEKECVSTGEARRELGGSISDKQAATALAAALAPRTSGRRRNTPPRLRAISGGSSDSGPHRG